MLMIPGWELKTFFSLVHCTAPPYSNAHDSRMGIETLSRWLCRETSEYSNAHDSRMGIETVKEAPQVIWFVHIRMLMIPGWELKLSI